MLLGLSAALVTTVCYGVASVLQARGARSAPSGRPGSWVRVMMSGPFLLGIVLDIVGFGFGIVAIRRLTLFVVQAVTSASLAVTAVAAVRLLSVRLRRGDVAALATVCAGLVLLALGSGPQGDTGVGEAFGVGLLVAATVTVATAVLVALVMQHVRRAWVPMVLGLLAGTGFGLVSVAVRVLNHLTPTGVFANPAAYTLPVGGLGGYLCYALALQRGAVTAVTAAVILGETLVPGLIGVIALGDRARPGFAWAAALGFVLAVGGAFALARFGELPAAEETPDSAEAVRPEEADRSQT